MLICPVLKWDFNTGPFGIQPYFNHLNTKPVRYSDPHCTCNNIVLNISRLEIQAASLNLKEDSNLVGESHPSPIIIKLNLAELVDILKILQAVFVIV